MARKVCSEFPAVLPDPGTDSLGSRGAMAQVSSRRSDTPRGMSFDSGCSGIGGRDVELGVVSVQGRHVRLVEEVDDSETSPCMEQEQLRF
eukprot:16783-Pyramimonas_sp.AAC.1